MRYNAPKKRQNEQIVSNDVCGSSYSAWGATVIQYPAHNFSSRLQFKNILTEEATTVPSDRTVWFLLLTHQLYEYWSVNPSVNRCTVCIITVITLNPFHRSLSLYTIYWRAVLAPAGVLLTRFHAYKNPTALTLAFSSNWFLPLWSDGEFIEAALTEVW